MSEAPDGWANTQLGELLSAVVGGGTPSKSNPSHFRGSIPFMTVKDLHTRFVVDTQDHISQEALDNSASRQIPADTLVIATRMSLGKITRPKVATAINQDLKALFLHSGIDKTYVEYLWRVNEDRIRSMGTGTTVKGIRIEDIRNLEVPLAPTSEQTRIAEKLDTLLARVDTCNDRFNAIPALLKRFRQAVLVAALEGDFSERDAFETRRISDLAIVGTGSTPLRSTVSFYSASGTPWITSAATSKAVITSASEYVTAAAIAAHRLKTYPVGTLLVAMYGEGKTRGQVAELGIASTINQACAAIVVDPKKAVSAYVKLALQANYLSMRDMAEGGNQPNLNLSKIKEFVIPYPALAEQTEIVRRVEALFALADRIEARCNAARAKALRLTPLLLAKAFRGELVPQDPNDEPASVLLARIQAERDTNAVRSPTASGRPRKAAQAKAKPKTRAQRKPKESAAMTKSRQDDDVKGKPYLAEHLRRLGEPATAEALFNAAELPVADFYKQLAWEVSEGHIQNGKGSATLLEAGYAA